MVSNYEGNKMTDNIRSQLHVALTHLRDPRSFAHLPKDGMAAVVAARTILEVGQRLPHYVFETETDCILEDGSAQRTVAAMFEAGVAHLPFPSMLLELWGGKDWRLYVVVEQTPEPRRFRLAAINYNPVTMGLGEVFEGHVTYVAEGERVPHADGRMLEGLEFKAGATMATESGGWMCSFSGTVSRRSNQQNDLHVASQAIAAINLALVVSHVGELDRERIDPVRLNKRRAEAGKTAIPTHTVVRIGHFYDRSGKRIRVTGTGRQMSIHMRAGHTRRQQHGEQWRDVHPELRDMPFFHDDHHPVFIAPVLVNYRDGSPLPPPLPKRIRM